MLPFLGLLDCCWRGGGGQDRIGSIPLLGGCASRPCPWGGGGCQHWAGCAGKGVGWPGSWWVLEKLIRIRRRCGSILIRAGMGRLRRSAPRSEERRVGKGCGSRGVGEQGE